ncbi:hypothetical protein PFISCL1PPCAC_18249, partial [Pristionchus fissidentatus]
ELLFHVLIAHVVHRLIRLFTGVSCRRFHLGDVFLVLWMDCCCSCSTRSTCSTLLRRAGTHRSRRLLPLLV